MEINKIFSERFSELVFESGITPKELAAVLAIDLTDIYAYLKGKNLPRLRGHKNSGLFLLFHGLFIRKERRIRENSL